MLGIQHPIIFSVSSMVLLHFCSTYTDLQGGDDFKFK
jgi:hypothetical protein